VEVASQSKSSQLEEVAEVAEVEVEEVEEFPPDHQEAEEVEEAEEAEEEALQAHLLSQENWEAIHQKNSTVTGRKVKLFCSISFSTEE